MIINSTELQNNMGKYLDLAEGQEIIVTRNGTPVARLIGMNESISFLSDQLLGILPSNVDEKAIKDERVSRQ